MGNTFSRLRTKIRKLTPIHNDIHVHSGQSDIIIDDKNDVDINMSPITDKTMNSTKIPTVFRWDHGGKNVFILGSFDGWKTRIPMILSGNEFLVILELEEGRHEFKFLVDNHWKYDPNLDTVDDGHFGRNNVIFINKVDTNVYESLKIDASTTEIKSHELRPNEIRIDSCNIDENEFTQIQPNLNELEHELSYRNRRIPISSNKSSQKLLTTPPKLPSYALNCILNKFQANKDSFGEPIELGVPDSVTLRHVYCKPVQDNIFSMSVSRRYRDKFITTIYFKPPNI